MKVLYIASYSGTSGANHSLVKMVTLLRDKYEIEPYVIIPHNGPIESMLIDNDINYEIIKLYSWIKDIKPNFISDRIKWPLQKILNHIREKKIQKIMTYNNVDILHVNATTVHWGVKSAKKLKIPIIWHIREFLEEDLLKKFRNRKYSLGLMKDANKMIAISHSVKKKYYKILNTENIDVVYNGIDESKYRYNNYSSFSNSKIKITMAGRIVPKKGYIEAIKAISLLVEEGYNLTFQIAGDEGNDQYMQELEDIIKEKKLKNNVVYLGYVEDMSMIWKSSDITLVCSTAEAFGRVTIEGMLGKSLVIGANTAGTKELIGDNKFGYLYKQGDYKSLAIVMKYALNNINTSRQIIDRAYKHAVENYTAEKNAKNIFNKYVSMLKH